LSRVGPQDMLYIKCASIGGQIYYIIVLLSISH